MTGPGVRAQRQRLERLWRGIEVKYGLLGEGEVRTLVGGNADQWAAHGLLRVMRDGAAKYPGFQFARGQLRPRWREMTQPLLDCGWTEEEVVLWFAAPTGWLDGRVPADLLDSDPGAVQAAVEAVAPGYGI